jgi:small subunit ribosomal protein S2
MANQLSVKDLIAAGSHFGHKASLWNPKMAPYIFGKYNGIHIIDIKETLKGFYATYKLLENLAAKGGEVLFVGTKTQTREKIRQAATECNMHYVTERWIGGTLTNFDTIRLQIAKLTSLEKKETEGILELYSKKEKSSITRELNKLRKSLSGIRNMSKMPSILIVVDPKHMKNAVHEAHVMKIPTVGLIDTDGNPDGIDIPIPINDDSMRVTQIIMDQLSQGINDGRARISVKPLDKAKNAEIKVVRKTKHPETGEKPHTEPEKPVKKTVSPARHVEHNGPSSSKHGQTTITHSKTASTKDKERVEPKGHKK